MATHLRTIQATITKTNDTGFQIAEQPGTWFNISKYASPMPVIPPAGTRVEASIDPRGFVMAIESLPQNGAVVVAAPSSSTRPTTPSDATATRLALLKIAARFLATRPEAKAADVLTVATSWESWVGR